MQKARWRLAVAATVGLLATMGQATAASGADLASRNLLTETSLSATAAAPEVAAAEDVIARFLDRPHPQTQAYHARRRLDVASPKLGKRAWMEVEVTLDRQAGFRYRVLASGGSALLRKRVLLQILRGEQEEYETGAALQTGFTPENYRLTPGGRDARGLIRLYATARRRERGLLDGQILVAPDTADLVQVSGTMAKGPSFWVRRLQMTKHYARLNDRLLTVRVESVSQMRLLGEARFVMTSEFDTVEGEPVERARILAANDAVARHGCCDASRPRRLSPEPGADRATRPRRP